MEPTINTKRRTEANNRLKVNSAEIMEKLIRERAYDIWLKTGNPDSVANWLLAEELVKG
jgi:hypothetical protein